MIRIDATDEAIIALFQADGRQSNREVARKLDLSEGTVRQRLKKLHDARAVRFDVLTDIGAVGIEFVAFARLSVVPRQIETVLTACAALAEIWYVAAVAGATNVIALIAATSADAARTVIDAHIATLPGVVRVDVRQVIVPLKHDFLEIVIREPSQREDETP